MGAHFCPSYPCPYCAASWAIRWGRVEIMHGDGPWVWPSTETNNRRPFYPVDEDYWGLTTG